MEEIFDIAVFDAGVKIAAMNQTKDLDTHFIFAGNNHKDHDDYHGNYQELETILRNKMNKYRIKSALLTWVWMNRQRLVSKKTMKDYYKGRFESKEGFDKESVHDDLDSFFQRLQQGENPDGDDVLTFYMPQLTEDELKLVNEKNHDYLETIFSLEPDLNEADLAITDSDSRFIHGICSRTSFMVDK